MSIVKRNNGGLSTFPSIFDDFFSSRLFDWNNGNFAASGTSMPAVNVKETPEAFEVEVAAPGMKKEDFKIELDNNVLTISTEKKEESEIKDGERYTRKEFSYQSFQRSFELSKDTVEAENIKAKYDNGVLHLSIPKKEEVKQKPSKQIQIQ